MDEPTTLTVRLPAELKDRLDRLAHVTERSKAWLAVDALQRYVELNEWQIGKIEAGIRAADAGDFATDQQVAAVLDRYAR